MGRGDKKTKKGKIFASSFGNVRPHKAAVKATPKKEVAAVVEKKTKAKKEKAVEKTAE